MITPRIAKSSLLIALLALVIPAAASAQATRTWVSGVGDDANPCSRTAPCKTFAGAISKTAAGGEVNCLDPGDFDSGALFINKAIAIKCQNDLGGILVSNPGFVGVFINAPADAKVTLRGLDINGLGGTGSDGIVVNSAGAVKIYDTEIFGFSQSGIDYEDTSGPLNRLTVTRTDIHDNGGPGVVAFAARGVVMNARVSNSEIDDNGCGVVVSSTSSTCGVGGVSGTGQVAVDLFNNQIHDMRTGPGIGVYTNGPGALVRLGGNAITQNVFGIKADNPGSAGIFSFGDNYIAGNGTNGSPNGTIPRTKRSG